MRNDSGKALTVFLIVISIVFISVAAISIFLLVKQAQLRDSAETYAEQLKNSESLLRAELQELKKQHELLGLKTKEAEEKIENLLEELDLAQGVRDQVGRENLELKESLSALKKTHDDLTVRLDQKEKEAEQRVSELQSQLDVALERNKQLEEKRLELEKEYGQLKEKVTVLETSAVGGPAAENGVDLAKIVVSAADATQGQVVSVDKEAEFLIANLGERQGIVVDTILAVYDANDQYIGDVKVTRVLPEMSAADFVPPLTSQAVSEGNVVKIKE